MNHLNFFTYYQNMNPKHENNLTRAFLICLENIPSVQNEFFKLISNSFDQQFFDSELPLDSILEETYTQISNRNSKINHEGLKGRKLVSILLSDEKLDKNTNITNDDRNAIYDGIILCRPNLVFVVENKPNIYHVWDKQLNPNISNDLEIEIVETPCSISWSEIIIIFNNLLKSKGLHNIEKKMIEDFLSYINFYRPELNPYTNLFSCNGFEELINKRCRDILSKIEINGEYKNPEYHPGWGYYISSGMNTIKQIKLAYFEENNQKYIRLDMVAADTQDSSKESYKLLEINRLKDLIKDNSIKVESNFHYQHMNKNLLWFKGKVSIFDYLNFWKLNREQLKQLKRNGSNNHITFDEFNLLMVNNGIISETEIESFNTRIGSKKYMSLNVCAGFVIFKYWTLEEAIVLENESMFIDDVSRSIERIYNVFNQSILK